MQIYPPGTRIGPYEIASNPMMGGMGVVYFCLDHGNDGRPVALKTFKPEYLPDRSTRGLFLKEGTAWVELGKHPHIVRCYGVEYFDPIAFLALELVVKEEGRADASLRSWMGKPLPLEQALAFTLQIARGMQHATQKIPGFVHRDLKPENVLVGSDKLPGTDINCLRVTDFGLAVILKDETGRRKDEDGPDALGRTHLTQGIVGTPLYMAPEQWTGGTVGVYTDVYALGCILYEMLTGQRAATGWSIQELRMAHCHGNLRPVPATLPGSLRHFLARALSVQVEKRYRDWLDVLKILETAYADLGQPVTYVRQFEKETISYEEHIQIGWSYLALGQSYAHMCKDDAALAYYKKAKDIFSNMGDKQKEGSAWGIMGTSYRNVNDIDTALQCFERQYQIALDVDNTKEQVLALNSLGIIYALKDDFPRAIKSHELALEISRRIHNRGLEGDALSGLGNVYHKQNDIKRAIGYYEKGLEVERELGNMRGMAADVGNLGNAYMRLGDFQRAIKYHHAGLKLHHEIGDRRGEGNDYGNLGSLFVAMKDFSQAIEHYIKALDIHDEINDHQAMWEDLDHLGRVFALIGNVEMSLRAYEDASNISKELHDTRGLGKSSIGISLLYAGIGQMDQALRYAQEAVQLFEKFGHLEDAAQARLLTSQLQQSDARVEANAMMAFKRANSLHEMREAVKEQPVLRDERFIQAIEKTIKEQVPPEYKAAFEEHLTWLKQIVDE